MSKFLASNLKALRKRKQLKQEDMHSAIGFTRTTWTNYETGQSKPDIEKLNSIASYFEVTMDDLMNTDLSTEIAKGKVKEKDSTTEKQEKGKLISKPIGKLIDQKDHWKQELKITLAAEPDDAFDKKNRVIPITDISVAAGAGVYNPDYVENVEAIRLPVTFLKKNATYLTVRIKGQSMSPTLQDGGYAVLRLLDRSEWAKMPDERIYAVTDTEGQTALKRVKNRFKQNFIVLMSDNPDKASYGNYNLVTNEISNIWYMEWYLSAKMPNIHDQYYSRLQRMEDQMDELINKVNLINPK